MTRRVVLLISASLLLTSASMAAQEVNVTRDLSHRYGEVQIAVNPRNLNNIVYVDVKLSHRHWHVTLNMI